MCTNDNVFDYQVLNLTSHFYEAYPNPPHKEILSKPSRPYNCLLIQSHYGYFICIPYRTEIKHRYAYMFKASQRSISHSSGLDYTKIVIVRDHRYISNTDAIIDQNEYNETRKNIHKIKQNAMEFVDDYVKHMKNEVLLSPQEFKRRYQFSPLPYFHNELGL